MATTYEWKIEIFDKHSDIGEIEFSDKLNDLPIADPEYAPHGAAVCLVRDVYIYDGELTDRQHFYITVDCLQVSDEEGRPAPVKYQREAQDWLLRLSDKSRALLNL